MIMIIIINKTQNKLLEMTLLYWVYRVAQDVTLPFFQYVHFLHNSNSSSSSSKNSINNLFHLLLIFQSSKNTSLARINSILANTWAFECKSEKNSMLFVHHLGCICCFSFHFSKIIRSRRLQSEVRVKKQKQISGSSNNN